MCFGAYFLSVSCHGCAGGEYCFNTYIVYICILFRFLISSKKCGHSIVKSNDKGHSRKFVSLYNSNSTFTTNIVESETVLFWRFLKYSELSTILR